MFKNKKEVIECIQNNRDDLDNNLALEYMGNNQDLYSKVVKLYVQENHQQVELMKEYLKDKKYWELYNCIHNIKGLSLNLGSRLLFSFSEYLCHNLVSLKENKFKESQELIDDINIFIEFYRICLETLEKSV